MIQREQVVEMFERIAQCPGWNMGGVMRRGYFFTDESDAALQNAARRLDGMDVGPVDPPSA